MGLFACGKARHTIVVKWAADIYTTACQAVDKIKEVSISIINLTGTVRGLEQSLNVKFALSEQKRERELKPVKEMFAKHLTDLLQLRQEVISLKDYFDKKLAERDSLYQELLKNYIALAMVRERPALSAPTLNSSPLPIKPQELFGLDLFDEQPLDSEEGYTAEELLLEGYQEQHVRQKVDVEKGED